MDKKNTLLLTVIAVATLLVAVVGATFAYFSLSVSGSASTTAKVTTGKVGTITMTSSTANLYLSVTATDMAQEVSSAGNKDYWAKNTNSPGEDTIVSNYNLTDTSYKVSTVTLSGADKGTKYHCTAKYTITISGDELDSIKKQIQTGDGELKLKTTTSSGVTAYIGNEKGSSAQTTNLEHTLQSLATVETESTDFWVIYDFTSTGGSDTADLEASFKLTNTQDDQNYLAGKEISIKIEADKSTDKLTVSKNRFRPRASARKPLEGLEAIYCR